MKKGFFSNLCLSSLSYYTKNIFGLYVIYKLPLSLGMFFRPGFAQGSY